MTTYSHTCGNCGAETIAKIKLSAVTCSGCKKLLTGLGPKDWDLDDDEMDTEPEYDPVKDRNKTTKELWGVAVTKAFNINMRLDGARVGPSLIGSVVQSRSTIGKFSKVTNGKVLTVKGGRVAGGTIMGASAATTSGRGGAGGHQGEEWLHLWGDNLGGPSSSGNFVAGSYAANTEMLVIEQALAYNIVKTANLHLAIGATCSAQNVGEYVTYKLVSPSGSGDFEHVIDLNNRYFTRSEYFGLASVVDAWLKLHSLLDL